MSTDICKNNIKCAVFDLDGTLLNTIDTINYYLNRTLERYGAPTVTKEECTAFVGEGARKLIWRALDKSSSYSDELFMKVFNDYTRAYDSGPYYLTKPYEGIIEMLSDLKKQGILLAVLSNKPDFATKCAIDHFFPNVFDKVAGAKDGIALKPDPTALLEILSELGVTACETAYIGDSEVDVKTAENAHTSLGISVTWGFRSRDELTKSGAGIFADSSEEVLKLIKFWQNTFENQTI